ncbi:hypothetical protein WA158_005243 [Blastocystis sp. Blastoise]
MVKFGHYLQHNLVPEWRYKFIDYKQLKKRLKDITESGSQQLLRSSSSSSAQDIGISYIDDTHTIPMRKISKEDAKSLTAILPNTTEDNDIDVSKCEFFSCQPNDSISEGLVICRYKEQWEEENGTLNFYFMIPEIADAAVFSRQQGFFDFLFKEIEKANQWYIEQVHEFRSKYNAMERQVKKYSEGDSNAPVSRNTAKKQITAGIKELYRGLTYLKNFSVLNKMAIDKITKKHDKLSGWCSRECTVNMVKQLRIYDNELGTKLCKDIETLWVQFKGQRTFAIMRELKEDEDQKSDKTAGGFLVGFFVSVYSSRVLYTNQIDSALYEYSFPLIRFALLMCVQLWMWALDSYVWERNKINYQFIFEAYKPKMIHWIQYLEIASEFSFCVFGILSLWLCNIANINNYITSVSWYYVLFFVVIILFFTPINFQYWQSKWYMLSSLFHLFTTPFYFVKFKDFFLGDFFTSHNQSFSDLIRSLCTLFSGSFLHQEDVYDSFSESLYSCLLLIPMVIPYFIRFLQCLRRYKDTKRWFPHLVNAGKYLFSMLAILSGKMGVFAFYMLNTISTIYSLTWDLVEDWGLLQNLNIHRPKFLLRNRVLYGNKLFYYFIILCDIIGRTCWLYKYLLSTTIPTDWLLLLFASIEIIRRGLWALIRLENEQLFNCGEFRAVLDVPIPFGDIDDDDEPV